MRNFRAATLLVALHASAVHAEPRSAVNTPTSESAVDPETFRYTTPAETNPVRATLELGGVFALGFVWYATTSTDIVHQWDVNYDSRTFRRKLTGQAFGPDTNKFGTNFVGHPLGGTGYYLSARSNRLTILESFGYSFAGSLLWELFGEVSEVVSMNDSLVTPLAGLAIGESTTQFGAFFDRSGASGTNRTFGSVFGPFKSLNDALDGLEPKRSTTPFPEDEWHRFELQALGAAAIEDTGTWWPEARFAARSRLARLRGYEAAGGESRSFDDGNVSSLELEAAVGRRGFSNLSFQAQVVLAGFHFRDRTRDARGAEHGGNGVLGVASTFRYAFHDYRRDDAGPVDRISSIEPVSAVFEQRGAVGGPRITTRLDAGPGFAGLTPYAPQGDISTKRLPPVLEHHGYYFGVGGHLAAAIEIEDGPVGARLDGRAESYEAFAAPGERPALRLSDTFTHQSLLLSYRLHDSAVTLLALADHRSRSGKFGQARASAREAGVGLGVGAVF